MCTRELNNKVCKIQEKLKSFWNLVKQESILASAGKTRFFSLWHYIYAIGLRLES